MLLHLYFVIANISSIIAAILSIIVLDHKMTSRHDPCVIRANVSLFLAPSSFLCSCAARLLPGFVCTSTLLALFFLVFGLYRKREQHWRVLSSTCRVFAIKRPRVCRRNTEAEDHLLYLLYICSNSSTGGTRKTEDG